jgi:hypothetical protein
MDQLGQVLKQQGLGALPGGFDPHFPDGVAYSWPSALILL